jgi:hypothetical protein
MNRALDAGDQASMKNAHERLGCLEFEKQLRDTRTKIRVALDRFIGEPIESKGATGVCHLVSVFGSDVDIGAIWAAIAGQECLTVSGPDLTRRRVSLGKDPRVLRGTVAVAGRSRSVRHLMALSAQMADDICWVAESVFWWQIAPTSPVQWFGR